MYSFLSSFRDAGYLGIYVGTAAEWVEEVLDRDPRELARRGARRLRADELARVKNQLKGNMLLGLETSDSRMSRIAKNEMYFRRDFPLERGGGASSMRSPTMRSSSWRSA